MNKFTMLALVLALVSMIMTTYSMYLVKQYVIGNAKMMCAWSEFATATEESKELCIYIKDK